LKRTRRSYCVARQDSLRIRRALVHLHKFS